MPAKVIDASALAALVFAEPDADSIDREIVGSSLVAPVLLYFELPNVCLHKMSRYPDKRDSLLEGFELAHKMGISQLEVDEDRATEGLCRAIAQCGALLAQHFPARPGDNPDELRNDLVQGR
jgi:uncharacterized protein with PIN domain